MKTNKYAKKLEILFPPELAKWIAEEHSKKQKGAKK